MVAEPAVQSPLPPPLVRLSALFLAVGLLVLGNGLSGTLLGVRATLEGMDSLVIGAVMAAYFVGFVLGSYYAPGLIESVGHIRSFAALASISSALAIVYAIFVWPAAWFFIRFVYGACYAGLVVVIESWLNASTARSERGQVLAMYNIVLVGAWVASQPLLALAPAESFILFAVTSISLSLALVPVTLARAGGPGRVAAERMPLLRLLRLSPLGVVGAFSIGMAMSAFWGMGPTFATRIGFDEPATAFFMAVTMSGALLFNWPLGRLSDAVDRRLVIIATSAASSLAAAVLVVLSGEPGTALMATGFMFGGLAIPIYSVCVAHVNDRVEPGEVVAVASRLVLVYGAGAALGPFFAGMLMELQGPAGLFVFDASVLALLGLFGTVRLGFRRGVHAEAKRGFLIVPRTTHAVLQLHRDRRGRGPGRRAGA